MKTRFGVLVVVLFALSATGCKMCCPSYDYCSPTNPGAANNEWCGKERRGSIFSGYSGAGEQVVSGDTIIEEGSPQVPQPAPTLPPAPAPQNVTPQTMRPTGYSRSTVQPNVSARRTR